MIYELTMPKLGLTMEKGKIVRWIKQPGDIFREGDVLLEVETDKSVVEVEAPRDGYLRVIQHVEGSIVNVGTLIAYLSDGADEALPEGVAESKFVLSDIDEVKVPVATAVLQTDVSNFSIQSGERIKASPKARKLATNNNVDLSVIRGSGPGGRIVSADILKEVTALMTPAKVARQAQPKPLQGGEGIVEIASTARRIIATRMLQSTQNIPQYYVTIEADMSNCLSALSQVKEDTIRRFGVKPTVTDILVKIAARVLGEYKTVNAYFLDSSDAMQIQYNEQVNIGIAVDVEGSLVVPVVKDAHHLSLGEIAMARGALVDKARRGRLKPDEMQGGTFTISNMGSIGVHSFRAIINPPESAILAAGVTVKKPVVVEGDAIAIRPMMTLTLTADHRIVDGAVAGHFLRRIVDLIEQLKVEINFL